MTPPAATKEAFSRVVIDAQLQDVGWNLTGSQSVRYDSLEPLGHLRQVPRYLRVYKNSRLTRITC